MSSSSEAEPEENAPAASDPDQTGPDHYTPAYRGVALALLVAVNVFNLVDRQILNILAQPIKVDLSLSDTQLGLITGLAFAVFYSLLALPIARYAERGDRPGLVAVAVSLWSAFTIACGFATNFLHMVICRLGVGVGEAGSVPPSHSLIVEFTPRAKRARAFAIFAMGIPIGSIVGLGLGGVAYDMFGWRTTFVIAGVPGLLLAVAVALCIKEPRRTIPKAERPRSTDNLWTTLAAFARIRTFRWMAAGCGLQGIAVYGVGAFAAPFFLRTFDAIPELAASFGLKPIGFLGLVFGFAIGGAGALGVYLGGWLGDRFTTATTLKSYPTVAALGALLCMPFYQATFQAPSFVAAAALLATAALCINTFLGPLHATCQGLITTRQRATMSAALLVIGNLVGLGIGPPLVGMLSDYARVDLGMPDAVALKTALMIVTTITLVGAFAFWQARRTIDAETLG